MSVKVLLYQFCNKVPPCLLIVNLDGTTGCTIEEVLIFFTGADAVPPLGFDKQPTVCFMHNSNSKCSTSSTCELVLRLPTRHGNNYASFRDAMKMSLQDNDGFGGV